MLFEQVLQFQKDSAEKIKNESSNRMSMFEDDEERHAPVVVSSSSMPLSNSKQKISQKVNLGGSSNSWINIALDGSKQSEDIPAIIIPNDLKSEIKDCTISIKEGGQTEILPHSAKSSNLPVVQNKFVLGSIKKKKDEDEESDVEIGIEIEDAVGKKKRKREKGKIDGEDEEEQKKLKKKGKHKHKHHHREENEEENEKTVGKMNAEQLAEFTQREKEKSDMFKEKSAMLNEGEVQRKLKEIEQKEEEEAAKMAFSRYADDEDMNQRQKNEMRWDDPMKNFFLEKQEKQERKREKELRKEAKRTGNLSLLKPKLIYRGPPPPVNRFNILPGHLWDGKDRGNGFEERFFAAQTHLKTQNTNAFNSSISDY